MISILSMLTTLSACKRKSNEIYVISDLHYASDVVFIGEESRDSHVADGRLQSRDEDLLDSLIDLVNANKPLALVLTGDVTFDGEVLAAKALSEKLSKVNKDTKVLVIPGNHDLYIQNCFIYGDSVAFNTDRLENDNFKEIFKEQGYKDAISIDNSSISYISALNDHLWLLMLDTTASRFNDEYKLNISNGYIDNDTFNWIEENLKYAKEHNIEVISFSHQNVLEHSNVFTNGYVIEQADRLLKLYKEYGVKLNMSGHLHIQNIKEEDDFIDIASSSILVYGNRYGVIEVNEDEYKYNSYKLNVKGINVQDESLNRFIDATKHFGSEITSLLRAYYFDGDYLSLNKLLEEHPEIVSEQRDDVLNLENKNQDSIIIKK